MRVHWCIFSLYFLSVISVGLSHTSMIRSSSFWDWKFWRKLTPWKVVLINLNMSWHWSSKHTTIHMNVFRAACTIGLQMMALPISGRWDVAWSRLLNHYLQLTLVHYLADYTMQNNIVLNYEDTHQFLQSYWCLWFYISVFQYRSLFTTCQLLAPKEIITINHYLQISMVVYKQQNSSWTSLLFYWNPILQCQNLRF